MNIEYDGKEQNTKCKIVEDCRKIVKDEGIKLVERRDVFD